MSTNKANKQKNFLMKILLAPIKILSRATDFYKKSMEDCAGKAAYTTVVFGGPAWQNDYTPSSSFRVSCSLSNDQELRQLLREISLRTSSSRTEVRQTTMVSVDIGRSYSVGLGKIGRIDEDRACSFREQDDFNSDLYPRSRSHAARRNII